MNILHVLTTDKFGGAEKVAIQIIHATENENNIWYVCKRGSIEEKLNKNSINSILIKNLSILKLKKICNKNNIDLVHAHDFKASLLCSFLNKQKVISHIHQSPSWINNKNSLNFRLYENRMKYFYRIFVTSKDIFKSRLFDGKSRVILLPNYVSVLTTEKSKEKTFDFLFLGRMEKVKEPLLFIDFIECFRKRNINVSAVMAGSGSLSAEVEKQISEKNLDIKLTGFLEDPSKIILESRFLVSTSSSEGFGLSMVEAMQLGIPVITYQSGGVTDEIKNMENGLTMTKGEIGDVINNILYILNDRKEYDRICRNAQKLGMKFSNFHEWKTTIFRGYSEEQ